MNRLLILLFPLLFALNANASQDSLEIYFFVAETCPICQYYTKKINEITEEYPEHKVILVFPNALSNESSMADFQKKYKIQAVQHADPNHELVEKFDAKVTPEVVIYNPKTDSVLYQGRIDDNYYKVGKRRNKVQSDDLINALEALSNNTPILASKTTAVGCFISRKIQP